MAEFDALLVNRDYESKKSKPEWGLNLAKTNMSLLDRFSFEKIVPTL